MCNAIQRYNMNLKETFNFLSLAYYIVNAVIFFGVFFFEQMRLIERKEYFERIN